jgi:hypothetical protein
MTASPRFTRDAIGGLSVEAARKALPSYEAEVKSEFAEIAKSERMTTVKAAYMTRVAIKAGLLKIGRGGKKIEGSITGAEFGARFIGANGQPVSQSTVGLWTNLGFVLCDVKGFDMDNERHAKLFSLLTSSGKGTSKIVSDAIRDEKASVAKIEKALKAAMAKPSASSETPASADSTSTSSGEGATDDEGNASPVMPVRSGIERVLEGLRLVQVALDDVSDEDFVKADRAFAKVAEEFTARRDALADAAQSA